MKRRPDERKLTGASRDQRPHSRRLRQLNLDFAEPTPMTPSARKTVSKRPWHYTKSAPPVPTPLYDVYWQFAAERQQVFFRRLEGNPPPWTTDRILSSYKFTNAYRASDRVSQYLIRHVIYRDDLSTDCHEVLFRILLFKLFNNIDTWRALENTFGRVSLPTFSVATYDNILTRVLESGHAIYSGAYIMPPGSRQYGFKHKHTNHLALLKTMMNTSLITQVTNASSMASVFSSLLSYPTIGPFLAYQFSIDINYSEITQFSEMDFVMPGPGAKEGIQKCFASLGDMSEADAIRYVTEQQEDEFARRSIEFRTLWGRRLQLIDCQNLFCEVAKYTRVSHPAYSGQGRSRIKQKFRPAGLEIAYWYPPKWKLPVNELTGTQRTLSNRDFPATLS